MTTDFRALCAELLDCLEKADWPHKQKHVFEQWIYIARRALAEADGPAVPAPPVDGEVAELVDQLNDLAYDMTPDCATLLRRATELLQRQVTDALADEPAVPEGREPAAVTEQPSDEELLEMWHGSDWFNEGSTLREFCSISRAVLARWGNPAPAPPADGEQGMMADTNQILKLAAIIREVDGNHSKGAAALAELILDHPSFHQCCNVPAPPADGEVAELVATLRRRAAQNSLGIADPIMRRAAELLQRQALVPVSVSERPWEREGWCNAEGRCWWGRGESDDWSADWTLATPEAVAEFCEFSPQTVCLPAHALPLPEVNND